jgi:serine/threonine protein kinase
LTVYLFCTFTLLLVDELGGLADGFGSDIGISVMSGSSGGWQHSAGAPALSPSNSFTNIPQQLSYSACMSMSNNEQARIQAPRGKGVFGTLSYMAPEILGQFSSEGGEGDRGQDYTSAVDWFSLGVLAHEFLFGIVPFAIPPHINYKVLRKVYPSVLRDHNHDLVASFASMFGARVAVDGVTDDVEELLNGLLALDKSERLGCSLGSGKEVLTNENDEFAAIKSLSFFGSIDFDLLERKKIPPPFVPSSSDVFQVVTDFPLSCDEALAHYRLATWRDDVVADESSQHFKKHRTLQLSEQAQELFQAWQFVHPKATLKEMVASVRKKGKM